MKIDNKRLNIRPYHSSDNLDQLTALIQSAYKVLLDKGFKYWGTYQSVEDTRKRITNGYGFIVEYEKEVIGTITLKQTADASGTPDWYKRKDVCFFSQFAITPKYQKEGIGSLVMNFIEEYAKKLGFAHIALDTCENAISLISYYEKRGYQFVEHVTWDQKMVNYRSVVLSKVLM